jgi:hypothetical protein
MSILGKIKATGSLVALAAKHKISLTNPPSAEEVMQKLKGLGPDEMGELAGLWDYLPASIQTEALDSPHFDSFVESVVESMSSNGKDPAFVLAMAKAGYPVDGVTLPDALRNRLKVRVIWNPMPFAKIIFFHNGDVTEWERDVNEWPQTARGAIFGIAMPYPDGV